VVLPELFTQHMVSILTVPVVTGAKRDSFPVGATHPKASYPDVRGFYMACRTSRNGAGEAAEPPEVL